MTPTPSPAPSNPQESGAVHIQSKADAIYDSLRSRYGTRRSGWSAVRPLRLLYSHAKGLESMVSGLLSKEARKHDSTHSEECVEWHHACALSRLRAALADIERLREGKRVAEENAEGLLSYSGHQESCYGDKGMSCDCGYLEILAAHAAAVARREEK